METKSGPNPAGSETRLITHAIHHLWDRSRFMPMGPPPHCLAPMSTFTRPLHAHWNQANARFRKRQCNLLGLPAPVVMILTPDVIK